MKNINGNTLNSLPKELHKIGDLFYLYYSIRSLYRTNKGELYICTWVERDDSYSRWLLFKVIREDVLDYLDNKISSLQLVKNAAEPLICFDVDEHQHNNNIVACLFNDLPLSYLPKPSAMFNEDNAPDIETIRSYLNGNIFTKQPLLEVVYKSPKKKIFHTLLPKQSYYSTKSPAISLYITQMG
jgi:hypothetical protein